MALLNKFQKDALKEAGNIGAGKASGALSKLVGKEVRLTTPYIDLIPVVNVASVVGGPKQLVVGTFARLQGSVQGTIMVVFPKKSALMLADLLQKRKLGSSEVVSKQDQMKLSGVGKVLGTSYLKALTDFLSIDAGCSAPNIISAFGESLSDLVLQDIKEKNALLLKTDFSIPSVGIEGDFILLLGVKSIDNVIKAIEKKM